MNLESKNSATIYKNIGETPLEALERFRVEMTKKEPNKEAFWSEVSMTYAGRLDPMAEGLLIILFGEECKNKEKYLGFDKEYEVEIVFGIETDSYDALGLAKLGFAKFDTNGPLNIDDFIVPNFSRYVRKFTQEYPPYSSKTFGGKQLHELARSGELPEEMPTKEVEIYEIEKIGKREVSGNELLEKIIPSINLVRGDFRQNEIRERWRVVSDNNSIFDRNVVKNSNLHNCMFPTLKLRVKCSSGTYMRSLAHQMGKDARTGAFALTIKRTKILGF